MDELVTVLATIETSVDVMELCGGEARVFIICVRRSFQSGGNYDLITGFNLNDPVQQKKVAAIIDELKPLVVVMAPVCKPHGPFSNLNYAIHYEAWLESYRQAAPHGRFCGRVALQQDSAGRFFLNEQQHPSYQWNCKPCLLYDFHHLWQLAEYS